MQEWDIIVYDALESPVLFYDEGKREPTRAIPVEHVRAVVEVKSALDPKSASKAAKQLLKLQAFMDKSEYVNPYAFLSQPATAPPPAPEPVPGKPPPFDWGTYNPRTLPRTEPAITKQVAGEQASSPQTETQSTNRVLSDKFFCVTVFFETNVKTLAEYRRALDALCEILKAPKCLRYHGGVILRSFKKPEHSGYLMPFMEQFHTESEFLTEMAESSSGFTYPNNVPGWLGCIAWDKNCFVNFAFDFLAWLRGENPEQAKARYGLDWENVEGSRLFHEGRWVSYGGHGGPPDSVMESQQPPT